MADTKDIVLNLLNKFGAGASGTTSREQAANMGNPNLAGLNPQQTQDVLGQPQREAKVKDVESQKALRDAQAEEAKAKITFYQNTDKLDKGEREELRSYTSQLGQLHKSLASSRAMIDPKFREEINSRMDKVYESIDGLVSSGKGKPKISKQENKTKPDIKQQTPGKIKVKRKSDGATGTIDAKDFNEKVYDKI